MLGDPLGKTRAIRRKFEVGTVDLDQLRQVDDADEAPALTHQRGRRDEPGADLFLKIDRGVGGEFESDDPPPPTALDRRPEIANQILGILLDLDVAVAQQPERARRDLAEPREDHPEMGEDDIVDGDEARALAGQLDEPLERRGDHQQFGHRLVAALGFECEDQAQSQVGDERERVRRVDRLRGQHGQDLLAEMALEPLGLGRGAVALGDHFDPGVAEHLLEHDPLGLLRHDQRVGIARDRVELLRRGTPVHRQILDPLELLPLQPRDPRHEEFVEVRARDRQKAQALEQGMRDVGRFLEHTPIERQPRQFAVEEFAWIWLWLGLVGHAARPAISPPSASARRIVGSVSRARSAMAKRSIDSTIRSAA